jgi:hypothetical protein
MAVADPVTALRTALGEAALDMMADTNMRRVFTLP